MDADAADSHSGQSQQERRNVPDVLVPLMALAPTG